MTSRLLEALGDVVPAWNRARPLILAALLGARPASAESFISAQPTVLLGADRVDNGNYETSLNIGVSARSPELAPGLTAEARLSLSVAEVAAPALALADNSSYLRLNWRPAGWDPQDGFALTVLPLNANRVYLGYSFPIIYQLGAVATGPISALTLRVQRGIWYAFAAVKTLQAFDELDHAEHRTWSWLAGGGIDLLASLRVEAAATRDDLGVNPEPEVLGKAMNATGMAARLLFHTGSPIGPPTDYARYRYDPSVWEDLLRPEVYDSGFSSSASAEMLYLVQEGLASPDTSGTVEGASALGLAAEGRLRWRHARAFLRATDRSLTLVQAPVPGFPPFYAFPNASEVDSEYVATVGGDYQFPRRLTPGLAFEVRRPAAFSSVMTTPLAGRTMVVVSDTNAFDALPAGGQVGLGWTARATLRWDTDPFSVIGEAFVNYDPNRTVFLESASGISQPTYLAATGYGFYLLTQARF